MGVSVFLILDTYLLTMCILQQIPCYTYLDDFCGQLNKFVSFVPKWYYSVKPTVGSDTNIADYFTLV